MFGEDVTHLDMLICIFWRKIPPIVSLDNNSLFHLKLWKKKKITKNMIKSLKMGAGNPTVIRIYRHRNFLREGSNKNPALCCIFRNPTARFRSDRVIVIYFVVGRVNFKIFVFWLVFNSSGLVCNLTLSNPT